MRMRNLLQAISFVAARAALLNLHDESLDNYVDNLPDETLLLVDFFRPGCTHCQRVSPVLEYLDKSWEEEESDPAKRRFKIAKVDSSKNPRLSAVFEIRRFPDLKFVRGGQWGTYEGNMTKEGFQEFKDRMAKVPLPAVGSDTLKNMLAAEEAVFVLVTEVEADPRSAARSVTLAANALQHRTVFATTTQEALSSLGLNSNNLPELVKLMVGPDGPVVVRFGGSAASASHSSIINWVEKHNYPLMPEFTVDNFPSLSDLGKLMVIGFVDPEAQETHEFQVALRKVASVMGVKHSDRFVFGTMDGVQFSAFAEGFNIYNAFPRMVVYDVSRAAFFSPATYLMDSVEIEGFLWGVLSGEIPRQKLLSDTSRTIRKVQSVIQDGGAWSLLLLIPIVGLAWVCCDTPEWEERRAKARAEKREAAETQRLKRD